MKKLLSVVFSIFIILYIIFIFYHYCGASKRMSLTTIENHSDLNVSDINLPDEKQTSDEIFANSQNLSSQDGVIGYNYYIEIKNTSSGNKYKHIKPNDINAANIAVKEYKSEYNDKKNTKDAEKGFLEFMHFYHLFLSNQTSLEQEAQDLIKKRWELSYEESSKLPSIEDTLRMKYEGFGININHDEGYFYVTTNYKYLYDNFASYLSVEWQELLKFNIKYQGTIISDAHFTIKPNDIRDIISFYENFKLKYPDFCKKYLNIEQVIDTYKKGLSTYPCAAI